MSEDNLARRLIGEKCKNPGAIYGRYSSQMVALLVTV